MSEEQTTFKVTDRRLFNSDGSPRELTPEEQAAAESASTTAAKESAQGATVAEPAPTPAAATSQEKIDQASASDAEDFAEAEIPGADDPASFVNFAMSIASNAASALGMMEHPATGKREVDLELGKHWIDVLGMLQTKTRGNITAPEAKIIEGWLADLRMQFVSLTSNAKPKPPAFTGRDIIGGK